MKHLLSSATVLFGLLMAPSLASADRIAPSAPAAAPVAAKVAPVPPPAPPAPAPVRIAPIKNGMVFTLSVPAVGSTEAVVDVLSSDTTIKLGDKKMRVKNKRSKKYVAKVVAVDSTAVTKAEVTYGDVIEEADQNGTKKKAPSPHSGKSYVVAAAPGGKLTITDATGAPASAAEAAEVTKDFDDAVGTVPPMARVVASKTWVLKQKVELTAEDLALLNRKPDAPAAKSGWMMMTAKSAKTATIVMEVAAVMKNDKVEMQLPTMKVTAVVDVATMRPISLKMDAKMTGTAQGLPMEGKISGTKKATRK